MPALTIGTRGSQLALRQARWVGAGLERLGCRIAIRVIRTAGDRAASVPLSALGQLQGIKGVFTKEIEEALIAGEIDMAVHSLKDLPTELDERLALGCVPRRADPRDALLGRRLDELRPGDRVGTGSPRRAAQLLRLRPDVVPAEIRGNVDTRIRKLKAGDYDAIILAAAGLERLGLLGEAAEVLDPEAMVPAIGQGALGIEIRAGDDAVRAALAPLHDPCAAAQVEAERSLLRALGGGCDIPLGAHAISRGGHLRLIAAAEVAVGSMLRVEDSGGADEAERLGARVAEDLRSRGVWYASRPA